MRMKQVKVHHRPHMEYIDRLGQKKTGTCSLCSIRFTARITDQGEIEIADLQSTAVASLEKGPCCCFVYGMCLSLSGPGFGLLDFFMAYLHEVSRKQVLPESL